MAIVADATRAEQTPARYPDAEGFVERDGVRVFWELYGDGEPTVLFLPTWSIIHSRGWKLQIPYLARHCRVVTFDGRGNGKSDRPRSPRPTRRPSSPPTRSRSSTPPRPSGRCSSRSRWGAERTLLLARRPPRARGRRSSSSRRPSRCRPARRARRRGAGVRRARSRATRAGRSTTATTGSQHYADFLEFFFSQVFTEPHSTKQIEDAVGWALETTPRRWSPRRSRRGSDEAACARAGARRSAARCSCSTATTTRSAPTTRARRSPSCRAATLVTLEGSGHARTRATR